MPAGPLDLDLQQGRQFTEAYTWTVQGVPQTLPGLWVPHAEIRIAAGGELLLDLTPMFTLDPARRGRMILTIPGGATAKVTRGGEWELVMVPVLGGTDQAVPLLRGTVRVARSVVAL